MHKTSNLPTISQQMTRNTQHEARDHQREWQSHVDAGRIGKRAPTDPEILARHVRNELVLRGLRVPPNWES